MNGPSSRFNVVALIFAASVAAWAGRAGAQPSLSHIAPQAVVPGKTTEVTLHGAKLDGPLRIWTSFPAHVEMEPAETKSKDVAQRSCRIAVSANAAQGIGGIAVATADGLSDIVYCMIDDLASVADNGKNHLANEAQPIALPAAIDGQSDGTLSDFYRFSAKAGERVSCEVVAARLGSDFDALIRVLDSSGNEILLADDDVATGADCRFVFAAPAAGSYLLEVRDNRYKPGGRYRVRLGDFPLATAALPPIVQRGTPTEIAFRGPLTDGIQPLTVLTAAGSRLGDTFYLSAKSSDHRSLGWTAVGLSDLPVVVGQQDSDRPPTIEIPGVASGALVAPRQRDQFWLAAKKGVPLRFRAVTRSVGSPAILSLRLLDASGKQVAESPVTDSDEPVLSFTPPADGHYDLAVEELASRGGSDFVYAVECTSGPQFSLLLKNDKNNRLRYSLGSGGTFYLDVQCQRAGYDGPIALAIDSDRPGWQIFNNVIAAKANEVRLYVVAPLDFAASGLTDLRIVGRAVSGGQEAKATMSTTVQLRAARPQTPYPPCWHDGAVFVSALSTSAPLISFANMPAALDVSRADGKTKFIVGLESADPKLKDATIAVIPVGLPAGVTADVKKNSSGASATYDVNLTVPKDLAVGPHPFHCFAYVEIAGHGRGLVSGDLRLNVVDTKPTSAP